MNEENLLPLTKTTQELVTKLKTHGNRKWTEETIEPLAIDIVKWASSTDELVLEAWLKKHGLQRVHLVKFCEYSPFFLSAYTHARQLIDTKLITGAMTRKYDLNAVKFYLCNRSDWKEKPETTVNVQVSNLLDSIDGQSKAIVSSPSLTALPPATLKP